MVATVDQADNTTVDATVAEQRLTDRLTAIETTWGATLRGGAKRLGP